MFIDELDNVQSKLSCGRRIDHPTAQQVSKICHPNCADGKRLCEQKPHPIPSDGVLVDILNVMGLK